MKKLDKICIDIIFVNFSNVNHEILFLKSERNTNKQM